MSDKNFKVKNGLDANGAVTITQPDTSTVPLTISANSLATGSDLFQVKRPDGTVRFAVGNDGALSVNSNINFNGGNMTMYPANSGQVALIVNGQTNQSVANLIVKAATGQSGNLQEWRDQNNNLAVSIGPDFAIRGIAGGFFGTANGNIVGVNYLGVKGWAANHIPFVVQGLPSQTGDLTRWVDSSANTLAKVDANGSITAVDLTLSGNLTVNGTTTNLNSINLVVEDKNIIIADVATPTDTTADGAGITIKGATDKTLNWVQSTGAFTSSEDFTISKTLNPRLKIIDPTSGYTAGIDFITNYGPYTNITSKIFFDFYGTANVQTITGSNGGHGMHYVSGRSNFGNHWFRKSTTDGVQMAILENGNVGINSTAPTATLHVNNLNSSTIGLIVKAVSSQTANLQEWQNSSGTVLASLTSNGTFAGGGLSVTTPTNTINAGTFYNSAGTIVFNVDTTNNAVNIGGGLSGITNNFGSTWGYDSSVNAGYISFATGIFGGDSFAIRRTNHIASGDYTLSTLGNLRFNTASGKNFNFNNGNIGIATTTIGTNNKIIVNPYSTVDNLATVQINTNAATNKGLVVQGYASQTANLTEWQNSAGTILAYVTNSGNIQAGTYNGVTIGLNYPGIVLDTSVGDNTQIWLRNLSSSTKSGRFVGVKARGAYADAVSGDDLVTLAGQQYINYVAYESGKILISNDSSTPSSTSYPARITFHTTAIGSTTLTERMRIDNAGLVGINMTPTDAYLSVTGSSSKDAIRVYSNGGSLAFWGGGINNNLYTNGNMYMTGGSWAGTTKLAVDTNGASNNGIVIRGVSGQTADLQVWQDYGPTTKASIDTYGNAGFGGTAANSAQGLLVKTNSNPAVKGIVVIGASSQTANLQEWQNNSGNILTRINSLGQFQASSISNSGLIVKSAADVTATITNASGNGTTVTYTASNTFSAGQRISISGITPSAYNLSYVLVASASSTQFTVTNSATGTYSSGGTATAVQTEAIQQWQDSAGNTVAAFYDNNNSAGSATFFFNDGIKNPSFPWGVPFKTTWFSHETFGGAYYFRASSPNTNPYWIFQSPGMPPFLSLNGNGISSYTETPWKPDSASKKGFIVQGLSSQTGDLQQWQNSAGTALAKIDASGNFSVNKINFTGGTSTISTSALSDGTLSFESTLGQLFSISNSLTGTIFSINDISGLPSVEVTSLGIIKLNELYGQTVFGSGTPATSALATFVARTGSTIPIVVRQSSSQTASLQEWQNNAGTRVSFIGNDGLFRGQMSDVIQTGQLLTQPYSASQIPLVVKGTTSQTANLQEWQNSAGTALASIGAGGVFTLYPTTSAQSSLTVKTDQAWTQSVDPNYSNISVLQYQTNASVISGNIGGRISFGQRFWNGSSALYNTGMIGSIKTSVDGGYDGGLTFHTAYYVSGSGPSLFERMRIDGNGTTTLYPLASAQGLIVKAAASQTADLQQWQNNAGTVLTSVDKDGYLQTPRLVITNGGNITDSAGTTPYFGFGSNQIAIYTRNAAYKGLVIQGSASQTANLQEWQDSAGTVMGRVDGQYGTIRSISGLDLTNTYTGAPTITARVNYPNTTPIIIVGAASQTANLQQWQNSAGTVLAKVAADGQLSIGNGTSNYLSTYDAYGNITSRTAGTNYSANISVLTGATNYIGMVIRGLASQTADLQQWQNSSGTVLARIASNGVMKANVGLVVENSTLANYTALQVSSTITNGNGIIVTGASGQTADLQQWVNSAGTVLAKVDANGNFSAISKSFDITHPTKENMRLRYASLEGPENGIYIRGTAESNIIELPEYWTELVHEDSITVSLTAVGSAQNIYVEKIEDNKVYIGGELTKAFFTVYGERKDIDKLVVEY